MWKIAKFAFAALLCSSAAMAGPPDKHATACAIPQDLVAKIQATLASVVQMDNGGLFKPSEMWSAVVDRQGVLCSVIESSPDAWPGSRAIAIAKANTANDFSNNKLAISTANLYSPTQPGGSLYGLNESNPFNPFFLPQGVGVGYVPGGIITFGGGVALYDLNRQIIGGLGVSGDTSCADHTIAYRMRHAAGLDGIPAGPNDQKNDNIEYLTAATKSTPAEAPNGFKHPHCSSSDIEPSAILTTAGTH